jgi:hypothetical protein
MRNVDDNLKLLADEYGKLKAELTKLVGRQKDIKAIFESAGIHELEGDAFRCVGSDVPDSTGPDWEKLARKFASTKSINHPSNQRVTKKAHYRVSVYGRTGVTL